MIRLVVPLGGTKALRLGDPHRPHTIGEDQERGFPRRGGGSETTEEHQTGIDVINLKHCFPSLSFLQAYYNTHRRKCQAFF